MAFTIERRQAGAQSATWFFQADPQTSLQLGPADWAQLPNGKLKTLLSGVYLDESDERDFRGFMKACASAGLSVNFFAFEGYGQGEFALNSDGRVYFNVQAGILGSVTRFACAYSASE